MDPQVNPEIYISRFEPMFDKNQNKVPGLTPINCSLYPILNEFRDGVYSAIVTQVRSIENKKERDLYKAGNLPAFTFSATFKTRRETANIIGHTGLLVIDIDAGALQSFLDKKSKEIGDYTIENFRDEIGRSDDKGESNVLFCGLSCSGNGVFIIYKIDPEKHLECFESIAWEFRTFYNVSIDISCKDVARLRFATWDPWCIIRDWDEVRIYEPSEEYKIYAKAQEEARQSSRLRRTTMATSVGEGLSKVIERAVNMIDTSVAGSRHNTLVKAARLLGGYVSGGGLDVDTARVALQTAVANRNDWDDPTADTDRAIEWGLEKGAEYPLSIQVIGPDDPQWDYFTESSTETQHQLTTVYSRIHYFNRSGVAKELIPVTDLAMEFLIDVDRLKSIITHIYKTNEDEFNIDNFPAVVKHEVYIKKRWEFILNEISQETFGRAKGSNAKWEKISVEDVYLMVSKTGFKCNFDEINRLFKTNSLVKKYNPIHEYFKSVAKENSPGTDFIAKLASYFTLEDCDMEYFTEMLRKMLVRTVKCAMETNYVNRYIWVMASEKQSTGKSWFLRWLSPWGMDKYYAETPMEEHKDSRIRMCEVLIYNLEELQTLTKLDVNRLKAIISQGSIKERRPYARNSETMPRICSFYGSTNRTRFLTDDINTRWLVFNVSKIDWNYRQEINVADIWAQATHLYYSGYDCELTIEECRIREQRNMEYSEESFEEALLLMYFEPGELMAGGENKMMASSDIAARLMTLSNNNKLNISAVSIGRFLNKYGFKSIRKGGVRLFAVRGKNQDHHDLPDRRSFTSENNNQPIYDPGDPPF